jgi:sporulation protein YlmC with PRC-barrel domain
MHATEDRATAPSLFRLSESQLTVANPAEDVRDRTVLDSAGEEVGKVEDLMVDNQDRRVRFLLVSSGGFLGFGTTTFLIPVDAITRVDEGHVYVVQTREHITGGPRFTPELVQEPDWEGAYGYYGYMPYWGRGYIYPFGFPYR